MLEIESSLVQESGMPCGDQRNHRWVLCDGKKNNYGLTQNQIEKHSGQPMNNSHLSSDIYFLIYNSEGRVSNLVASGGMCFDLKV